MEKMVRDVQSRNAATKTRTIADLLSDKDTAFNCQYYPPYVRLSS